jgi:hypothetical protein
LSQAQQAPKQLNLNKLSDAGRSQSQRLFDAAKTLLFNRIWYKYKSRLLAPTDSVKDRLASYFYWNDEQALLVAKNHKIDLNDLKRWAKSEEFLLQLKHFLEQLV